jgi:hypothetical protein
MMTITINIRWKLPTETFGSSTISNGYVWTVPTCKNLLGGRSQQHRIWKPLCVIRESGLIEWCARSQNTHTRHAGERRRVVGVPNKHNLIRKFYDEWHWAPTGLEKFLVVMEMPCCCRPRKPCTLSHWSSRWTRQGFSRKSLTCCWRPVQTISSSLPL